MRNHSVLKLLFCQKIRRSLLANNEPPESIEGWSWGITKEQYNKKLKEWTERQAELDEEMARYTQADEKYYIRK